MEKKELPKGWAKAKLSEFCTLNQRVLLDDELEVAFIPMAELPTTFFGNVLFEKKLWMEVKRGYTQFQNNDVLLAKITPCFENGKATLINNLPNGYGAGSTEYFVLRALEGVSPKFLYSIVKSFEFLTLGTANMSGSVGHRRVPKTFIENYPVLLPPPTEQQEIVRIIESHLQLVDQIKSRLDALPKILEQFRQSVLASAVSGKLTEDWRELHDIPNDLLKDIQVLKKGWVEQNKDHNEAVRVMRRVKKFSGSIVSQELPRNWSLSNLEDCVLMIVDCHNKTAPYEPEGVPLIRTSNIRNGKFVWEDLKYVSQTTFEFWSRRCIPESGDLIFTREAPMGEVAIIPKNKQVCLGQRTMLIRPIEEKLKAYYLLYVLMNPEFTKKNEAISVGSGVKHYRVRDVSEFEIPIPPLEEQKEIVKRVENLFALADQIESKIKKAQERVNLLTQSILAKAFRGEFTAKWREENPDLISGENSAEALLKRIEEAKKAAKKKK